MCSRGREPDAITSRFQAFFWPLVSDLVKPAITQVANSAELLDLCLSLFKTLKDAHSPIVDTRKHLDDWGGLLQNYTTFEVRYGSFEMQPTS